MKILAPMFVLLAGAPLSLAQSKLDPAELFKTAQQQRDIFSDLATPLELQLNFVAQLNVPAPGHLTLRWAAKDRWWSKVTMGDFEQIRIRNGEWTYTVRNAAFTPVRVQQLMELIGLPSETSYIGKKAKQRTENGISLTCVQTEPDGYKHEQREICLDAASNDILRVTLPGQGDGKDREFYQDYFLFQGHRYPHRMVYEEFASRVIKADVATLIATPFDDRLLVPPPGAIERRTCKGMTHPVPIKKPDAPFVGVGNSTDRMTLTILTDGSVGDVQLIARGGQKMDQTYMKLFRQWKFRPAMCGNEPVVADIQIETNVRSY